MQIGDSTQRPAATEPKPAPVTPAPAAPVQTNTVRSTSDGFEGTRVARSVPAAPAPIATPAAAAKPPLATAKAATAAEAAPVGDDFAARRAQFALKVEPGKSKEYDGMYIGADGYAYPPGHFQASEVPPFKPDAPPVPQPAPAQYYVNGVLTGPVGVPQREDGSFIDPAKSVQADGEAQKLANASGTNVVLVYNATEGNADFAQAAGDKLGVGDDPAYTTLANAIYADVKAGKEVRVTGYSQGGAITARALNDVRDRLYNDTGGPLGHLPIVGDENRRALDRMMGQIHVTTFAGAGAAFPDGPSYDHYVNSADPVPNLTGVGGFQGLFSHPGRGARIHTFEDPGAPGADILSADGVHGLAHYLDAYKTQQTWDQTVAQAPSDVQAILGKADFNRVRELTSDLGLSPTQLYALARTQAPVFTQHEGNGYSLRGFVQLAKSFGAQGDGAAALLDAVGAGNRDPQYALAVVTDYLNRVQPRPTTPESWLSALQAHLDEPGSVQDDDYRQAFASTAAYLRGLSPGSAS